MPASRIRPKTSLHPPRVGATKKAGKLKAPRTSRHAGLKRPGAKLAQLLEWVNLVPPKETLPFSELAADDYISADLLLEAISKLPAALQAHLLKLMNRPDEWPLNPNATEWWDIAGEGEDRAKEWGQFVCRNNALSERYRLIANGRRILHSFAALRGRVNLTVTVPTELILDIDKKRGAFVRGHDPLLAAILGERLDYIRVCPICDRIFFAGRVNQDACPETCADALRQRNKRARDKMKRDKKLKLKTSKKR
jgi:hypothetical protein